MVNTRRTESNGSTRETRHLRTRGSVKIEIAQGSGSSTVDTDSEESNDEGCSSYSPRKSNRQPIKKKTAPPEVNEICTRFKRNFNERPVRGSINHIAVKERRSLSVYSRNMDEEFDDSEEEFYSRGRRTRHLIRKNRLLRRTALSLRPIRGKCYTDQHSPYINSDSDPGVKRSTRLRRSVSWLTDNQMHKVGYPTLNSGYSEEDSRDVPDGHQDELEVSQRVTRHSNRLSLQPPRYVVYDDYDDDPPEPRRRRRKIPRPRHDSNEKENKEEDEEIERSNGRLRNSKADISNEKEEEDENEEGEEEVDVGGNEDKEEDNKETKVNGDAEQPITNGETKGKNGSSDSDGDEPLVRTRRTLRSQNSTAVRSRPTRQAPVLDTSSESEEETASLRKGPLGRGGRKYCLRDRPKPAPKAIQTSVLRNERREIRSHRRFTRRRKSSSGSDSTTSSDRICKPPKSPHGKNEKMKSGAGGSSKIVPIKPEMVDTSIRFNSIGGLDGHVQCLKEMILLPMMYPEVFRQFQVQPPKGVLFYGPPGTGKTLIARALANECSFGQRRVSFFMRKGADLLSKWIGESEKQLRMLFEQAAEMKPSIIFFDELDGLAPVRSSRQDQVHASIVSTLLALMDGLDKRGDVIVIGATNRVDAIDPALRRPGRFDRELFFPLPSRKERDEILNVHVSQWAHPPSKNLLCYLAENTVGYCGSDLKALCTEAVIQSFRRTYPQVYGSDHRLLLEPENVKVEKIDFLRAKSYLVPASHRVALGLGRKLLPILEPLLQDCLKKALGSLEQSFPHGLNAQLAKVKLSPNVRPAQLLLTGRGKQHGQTTHLGPALLFKMEHIHAYNLDLTTLHQEIGRTPEEVCIQVFNEARRNIPSIIYIPSIDRWWQLVSITVQAIVLSQIAQFDPNTPILLLATSETAYNELPRELQNLFSCYRKEVLEVGPPDNHARTLFFESLLVESALRLPRCSREKERTPPPLPRAPTPPPSPLTEVQLKKLYETEEHTLRELRIFLRDMCKKLANNKLFFMFTKPVDTEEVPDYTTIIKQPMDLETMMTKVDFHRYECAKDFLMDIELICANALEYNPAKSSADKQIRHRACSLRDYAYSLIKTEMDSDFEEKCQDIKTNRRERKACTSKYLPAYIHTPDDPNVDVKSECQEGTVQNDNKMNEKTPDKTARISPPRKRKFSWQKGLLKKRKKPKVDNPQLQEGLNTVNNEHTEEKASSDESKENEPDSSAVGEKNSADEEKSKKDGCKIREPVPTSDNCDKVDVANSKCPPRRLSNLMSPSELLDNHLDFDDVDKALNETVNDEGNAQAIECSVTELEKVLDQAVKMTDGYSLLLLLDLHNQLSRIIKKFSKTFNRMSLPKELSKELMKFKRGIGDLSEGQPSKNSSFN